MAGDIQLNPEIARLALATAGRQGVPFKNVLARTMVEQAITELDAELGFILNPDESLAETDLLSGVLRANDVAVNSHRLHVAAVNEEGLVEIPAALIVEEYLSGGILAVSLKSTISGAIVQYVSFRDVQPYAKSGADILIKITPDTSFSLAGTLAGVEELSTSPAERRSPSGEEYLLLIKEPARLSIEQLQNIVAAACTNSYVRQNLADSSSFAAPVPQVLSSLSQWAGRVEKLVSKLAPRFAQVQPDKLRRMIRETGENFGGQTESPAFRQSLLKSLAKEELSSKLSPEYVLKVTKLIDVISAGKSAYDGVKGFISNQMAFDLAKTISDKRDQFGDFSRATAEELGLAFHSLAVQPAYATHSATSETVVEEVNEALVLLEATDWLEEISEEF